MGRPKKDKDGQNQEVVEESIETPVEIIPQTNTAVQVASKQFVKKLRTELKEENKKHPKEKPVSEQIFTAFIASVSKVDTEENYRRIWTKTFKRN